MLLHIIHIFTTNTPNAVAHCNWPQVIADPEFIPQGPNGSPSSIQQHSSSHITVSTPGTTPCMLVQPYSPPPGTVTASAADADAGTDQASNDLGTVQNPNRLPAPASKGAASNRHSPSALRRSSGSLSRSPPPPLSRLSFFIDGAHTPESMVTCAEWFASAVQAQPQAQGVVCWSYIWAG